MSVLAADIHKAINTVWEASTLNASFIALWKADVDNTEFEVLNELEGARSQPFPYCVYEQSPLNVVTRMSGGVNSLRHIHDIPWSFHVHARKVEGDSRTSKEIAATLVEEIMKVVGGHPTVAPTAPSLDNGNFLIAQYQNDFPLRTGENEWQWDVNYNFKVDVPVAV